MPVTFTKDFKQLEKQVKKFIKWPMADIGIRALELNFDQIQKKTNADGTRFKNYNAQYAFRKGVAAGAVDLTSKASASSGRAPIATMLKSYGIIEKSRYSATLGFRGQFDKLKASWNVRGSRNRSKARPFVGLTRKNEKKLLKFVFQRVIVR